METLTLWEEKNSIEQKKNLPNNQTIVLKDTTNETKNGCVKKECEDIGQRKIWKRNCPKCGCDIFHVEKWTRNKFDKEKRTCGSCRKSEDITGKKFGYLIAIKRVKVEMNKNDSGARWLFKCICGKKVIKRVSSVKKGNGDNCGCKWGEKVMKTKGIKEYEWLYGKLKWRCQKKNIVNELLLKEFIEFTNIKQCHYCNSLINWAKHSPDCGTESENNGYHLDRKNNNLPYSKENCVVCCNRCNFGKSNLFSYEDWYGMTQYLRDKNKL